MRVNSRKVIKILEQIAPTDLAESWDNVGFQIGNVNKAIGKIMVCLEVTDLIVEEAINKNVDLIITHHPLIFRPLKTLTDNDPVGTRIRKLIQNDINLYSAHTNLDIARGGLNDYLANLINLERVDVLSKTGMEQCFKLVVYVPKTHIEDLHFALVNSGAGHIGNYSDATFRTSGIGTFKAQKGANPHIGEIGVLKEVEEVKIETIVSKKGLKKVLDAMIKAHPYEEVAYDIIAIENEVNPYGIGRVGYLPKQITLRELIEIVKVKLGIETIKYVGNLDKKVSKVSICTGAGSGYIKDSVSKSCNVMITGDLKYHEAMDAEENNIAIIDAGHFETENIYCHELKRILEKKIEEKDYDLKVILSDEANNPIKYM